MKLGIGYKKNSLKTGEAGIMLKLWKDRMLRKAKGSKSKKSVGITCQCKDWAVERPKSMLREVVCPKCHRVFRTNREDPTCFNCKRIK
jgi:hypothetical protein